MEGEEEKGRSEEGEIEELIYEEEVKVKEERTERRNGGTDRRWKGRKRMEELKRERLKSR